MLLVRPHPGTFLCHTCLILRLSWLLAPGRGIQEGEKPHHDSAPIPLLCLRAEPNPRQLPAPPQASQRWHPGKFCASLGPQAQGRVGLGCPCTGWQGSRLGGGQGTASLEQSACRGESPSLMAMPVRNHPFSSKSSNHEQDGAFWDQGADIHPWETVRAT